MLLSRNSCLKASPVSGSLLLLFLSFSRARLASKHNHATGHASEEAQHWKAHTYLVRKAARPASPCPICRPAIKAGDKTVCRGRQQRST
ncbi:hypothetical protein GQ53DRAFT_756061 [Thozetella sp. PMI_491]|nr:hypothetical protein GQ53DRAFT_756061 [Thozetella sp. PMI_491]